MRYIANPFSYFINGSERKSFTHNQTGVPYHIYVGTKGYVYLNLLVFAENENRAKQLLIDALRFRLECGEEYHLSKHRKDLELVEMHDSHVIETREILDFIINGTNKDKYELILEEFIPNQFLKISWASNDTVL